MVHTVPIVSGCTVGLAGSLLLSSITGDRVQTHDSSRGVCVTFIFVSIAEPRVAVRSKA